MIGHVGKISFLASVLILFSLGTFGQVAVLPADATQPLTISTQTSWLLDSTSSLTVADVQNKKFEPVTTTNFRTPFSDATFWYKCTLLNTDPEQEKWYIQWDNPVVEYIEVYVPAEDGTYQVKKGGTFIPRDEVSYRGQSPYFAIQLPAGQQQTIFIKLNSQRGLRNDILLANADAFATEEASNNQKHGFLEGLVTLRLFFVLVLALFAVKEMEFRAYSFMLVIRSLSFWGLQSALGNFFTDDPVLATSLNFLSYHLIPIGYVVVIKYFLPINQYPAIIRYLLNGILIIVLLLCIPILFDYRWYWLLASQYLVIFSQCLLFGLFAVSAIRKHPIDWYYSVPFLLGVSSYFFLLISAVGILNAPWVFSMVGLLFISEIFVFGIFLGKIILKYEKSRATTQRELVFNQTQSAKLRELDTLKSNFFANISHEFRTPLTLLVGPLADFQKKYPTESLIPVMKRNIDRLQSLIGQLLDLSKMEAGQLTLKIERGNLSGCLRQWFSSFESLAQSKKIIFNYHLNQEQREGYFDRAKLETIVNNLLSNAFKFTHENGRISIHAEFSGRFLLLKVQDFGLGIDPVRLPHIFDRFYRGDFENHQNYEGTGIGLALVKELVQELKGQIWVESEPNIGSTFTVRLPIDAEKWEDQVIVEPASKSEFASAKYSSPALPGLASSIHSPRDLISTDAPVLLLVEDNPDLRYYIKTIFEGEYQIMEAVDGLRGLEIAFSSTPDLIICDVMMPRLDGFSFGKQLKSDVRTSHIPLIMLTAKSSMTDRLEGLELGADEYLTKPFNREELEIRVRSLLKQRSELRKLYSQQLSGVDKIKQEPSGLSPIEEKFIQRAAAVVHAHLGDSSFSVDQLCEQMKVSRTQMHRKLKALTNQSTTEFIRTIRIYQAAELLQNHNGTVSEIAYQVGFESLSYFSKTFQEVIGLPPSEWLATH